MKITKILATVDDIRLLTKKGSGYPISTTIEDLAKILSNKVKWCLCGGLAVGVHARPRGTDDVDILLMDDSVLLYVYSITSSHFKKLSDHMIIHKKNGVEVDLVTPEYINVNSQIVHKAIETSKVSTIGNVSIPVVTREGLVALKLCRGKYIDLADIESIVKNGQVNVSDYQLTKEQISKLNEIQNKT
jgi:hypothetical protein